LRNHFMNNDFVILYRTNAQSRSFEESLRRMNIPYRLIGGLSFYQRKEIKDFLAYLRVVVNTNDEENLKRIINYPTRGIGKTTIDKISVTAHSHQITFYEALKNCRSYGFSSSVISKIDAFVILIENFRNHLEKMNAYELAFFVGKNSGLVAEVHSDKSVEGLARYENVQEMLNAIKEFTMTPDDQGE